MFTGSSEESIQRSKAKKAKGGSGVSVLSRVDEGQWERDADLHQYDEEKAAKDKFPTILILAFQAIGVIYGDIGTSPLYTLQSIFTDTPSEDDIISVLSCIIWTFTIIVMVKYVAIVLRADDNGQGGTFALFSLIKRQGQMAGPEASASMMASDRHIKQYTSMPARKGSFMGSSKVSPHSAKKGSSVWTQRLIANPRLQSIVRWLVVAGVGFIMGDGILTPAQSVVSAVEGLGTIKDGNPVTGITRDTIVYISLAILFVLFVSQQFGTGRLGLCFSPIITIWFLANAALGLYNIIVYAPGVLRAFSPHYIFLYFMRDSNTAWVSLGGMVLAITGCEALFADLGHFSRRSISLSAIILVYPSLMLAYIGQSAFLLHDPTQWNGVFWNQLPGATFWPMFVVATLATIVASQALISATFQIVKQAIVQGFFPQFAIYYTSKEHRGQVYIPLINYLLMALCLIIVGTFRSSANIGQAYGLAVLMDMILTTHFMCLVMMCVWQVPIYYMVLFYLLISPIEFLYLSSAVLKVPTGAWFTLMIAALYAMFMLLYFYGSSAKKAFFSRQRIRLDQFLALGSDVDEQVSMTIAQQKLNMKSNAARLKRCRGTGIYYSPEVYGVPPVMLQTVSCLPVIYEVNIFLTNRSVPVPVVAEEERLLVEQLGVSGFYHVVARYGYTEEIKQGEDFVRHVLGNILQLLYGGLQMKLAEQPELAKRLGIDDLPAMGQPRLPSFKEDAERNAEGNPMTGVTVVKPGAEPAQAAPQKAAGDKPTVDTKVLDLVVTKLTSGDNSMMGGGNARLALLSDEILVVKHAKEQRSVIHIMGRSFLRLPRGVRLLQLPRRLLLEQLYKVICEFFSSDVPLAYGVPRENLLEVVLPWSFGKQ